MNTEFKLTKKYQFSKRCKDGKNRNFLTYFLNDVKLLKQKIPFDTNYEKGFDRNTAIYDDYLLNGSIHQKRTKGSYCGISKENFEKLEIRDVKFPVSKKILQELNAPKDIKIYAERYKAASNTEN